MSIYDSDLWIDDLDSVIMNLPELEELAGKTILITGATGLICSALIDTLIRWNETKDSKIKIIAAGRSKEKVSKRFYPYSERNFFSFLKYDANSCDNSFCVSCDYIIHGASNASPNHIITEPVETMVSNFVGVKILLDYARKINAKRLLYISSSEVYGKKKHNNPSRINEYDGIDILNMRNSYSISKCAAETLCVSYYKEYGVDSLIVRPGHIYGPTARESDNRVSSAWPYAAVRGEDVVMKSSGEQIRSYCYCLDCASAILKVLLKGKSAHAYNISNPESIYRIREIAEIITDVGNVSLKVEMATDSEKSSFNPMINSSLDSRELLELGWSGMFDGRRGFEHTVKILSEGSIFK